MIRMSIGQSAAMHINRGASQQLAALAPAPPPRDRAAHLHDTAEYLRLRRAGCERELFAFDAIALLHEATAGAMRDLDRLAAAALRETARRKRKLVERDTTARVIEEDTRERDR